MAGLAGRLALGPIPIPDRGRRTVPEFSGEGLVVVVVVVVVVVMVALVELGWCMGSL